MLNVQSTVLPGPCEEPPLDDRLLTQPSAPGEMWGVGAAKNQEVLAGEVKEDGYPCPHASVATSQAAKKRWTPPFRKSSSSSLTAKWSTKTVQIKTKRREPFTSLPKRQSTRSRPRKEDEGQVCVRRHARKCGTHFTNFDMSRFDRTGQENESPPW